MTEPRAGPDVACLQEVRLHDGRCTACVDARHAGVLAPFLAQQSPEQWPGFAVVKRSTVRTVLAGAIGDLEVHVKLYRATRWSDRARDLLQGARARVEFRNLQRARDLGLAAAEPIAFGITQADGARSFLLTRTIAGATALPRGPLVPELAAALGRLLRCAHDRGLHAFDLHAGNVVTDDRGQLWLVDLTSVRFGEALDRADRARGLAFLLLDLDGGPRHRAASPLLAAYGASPELRAAAAQAWHRLRQRALAAFGRRATRACKDTAVDMPARGIRIFRHVPAGIRAEAAVQREATLAEHTPAKSGRRGAVWVFDDVVAKRRNHAAARRLFRAAYWCGFAGVDCARPLALVERRSASVVVVERIAAPDLARQVAQGALPAPMAVRAAARLGNAVGRLHAHGLRNRDLKFENLVLDPTTGAVVMVDLDGLRRQSPSDRRGQAADLGRLLAAFRSADAPGGVATLRSFLRSYTRASQCLGASKLDRFMRRRIAARASGWAKPCRSTSTS